MAILNHTKRQGEFVPKGAEPGLTHRFVWRDADQEKAVRDIATARFNFPSPARPDMKTYTNRPEREIGVRMLNGELAFPDIVAVDRDAAVKMMGEVETARTLRDQTEQSLTEKWLAFAALGDLYLFVPLMQLDNVRRMVKRNRVKVAGIRTWRYIAGQDILDVSDV